MLNKLSKKIGFTQTEIKVILFLIVMLLVGFSYTEVQNFENKSEYKKYDYSKEDSIFNLSKAESISNKNSKQLKDKKVDYKQEVLDFNKTNFKKNVKKSAPAKKSINLNTAGKNEFVSLPGIGKITAQRIIALRKKLGGFKSLKDLLRVKGIGNSKFSKIKKYIYIEE